MSCQFFKTKHSGSTGTYFFATNSRPGLSAKFTDTRSSIHTTAEPGAQHLRREFHVPGSSPATGESVQRAAINNTAFPGRFQCRQRSWTEQEGPVLMPVLPLRLSSRARPCTELPARTSAGRTPCSCHLSTHLAQGPEQGSVSVTPSENPPSGGSAWTGSCS